MLDPLHPDGPPPLIYERDELIFDSSDPSTYIGLEPGTTRPQIRVSTTA